MVYHNLPVKHRMELKDHLEIKTISINGNHFHKISVSFAEIFDLQSYNSLLQSYTQIHE